MASPLIKTLATYMLILSVTPKARCALGEDETHIALRFGYPVDQRPEKEYTVRDYHFNLYNVSVFFWNGKSAREEYQRSDGRALSDSEIAALLSMNAAGQAWEPMSASDEYMKGWTRDNENVIAGYNVQERLLAISLPAFDKMARHSID